MVKNTIPKQVYTVLTDCIEHVYHIACFTWMWNLVSHFKERMLSVEAQGARKIWCEFDRASPLICGNKMPTRCNRWFLYCRSYCLLNMFRAPLCPSSGAQEYYTGDCCLWCLVFWISSCRSGVDLWVVCPVCGMLLPHMLGRYLDLRERK